MYKEGPYLKGKHLLVYQVVDDLSGDQELAGLETQEVPESFW